MHVCVLCVCVFVCMCVCVCVYCACLCVCLCVCVCVNMNNLQQDICNIIQEIFESSGIIETSTGDTLPETLGLH